MAIVKIVSFDGTTHSIQIGSDDNAFNTTTVAALIEKANKIETLKGNLQNGNVLQYNDKSLEEQKTLSYYGIKNNSTITIAKIYDPYRHFGIKFTQAPDAITGDNYGHLRALLSCGHAVDPTSLTAYCRSLVDGGKFKFICPAIIQESPLERCNAEWAYTEVRHLALLNQTEMEYIERKLNENAERYFLDIKDCPNCLSCVERQDLSNLRVSCTWCKSLKNEDFDFCWQCEREWTVTLTTASDTCGRENCENKGLKILENAMLMKLPQIPDLPEIPSVRACPTCGNIVEHNQADCKNVTCNRCEVEFCFVCLEITRTCQMKKPGSYYSTCATPVAPKQTKIPIWNRQFI